MSTTTKTPAPDAPPEEDLRAEIEALKKQLADAAAKPAAPAPDEDKPVPAKPTHFQALACGHSVITGVPVASHHFCDEHEVTVPVTASFELGKED